MKFSMQWLREWVNPPLSNAQLGDQLTLAGFELEDIRPCAPDLENVVAARLDDIAPHPRAPELTLCRVDAGAHGMRSVVCGAPGLAAGRLYALALPGARLGVRTIRQVTIGEIVSDAMLCSGSELGLSDEGQRLLLLDDGVTPGTALEKALRLDDEVAEFAITPNRGDCLCIAGLAREVSSITGTALKAPTIVSHLAKCKTQRSVKLAAPAACPRYAGRVLEKVDAGRPTPAWMAERLRRAGLRSISIVVDITNYVMLELGQPMHAFDADRLRGTVTVRHAAQGETLRLLDESNVTLAPDALVIADESGAIALAGIMGGAGTAVSTQSRTLFLESAFFAPAAVQGRARGHGLQTDASLRFERGVDPALQVRAIERATQLVIKHCGGLPGPVTDTVDTRHLPPVTRIALRHARLEKILGVPVERKRCGTILKSLGMRAMTKSGGWDVEVPSYRFDVALEEDLVEEVGRIFGYARIPAARVAGRAALHDRGPNRHFRRLRTLLADRGYSEAITFSFIDPAQQQALFPEARPIPLQNPIAADMAVMRCSLLPGLLNALNFNVKRQFARVRLFEIGRVFTAAAPDLRQDYRVAGVVSGPVCESQWDRKQGDADFFDLKGDVEALLETTVLARQIAYKGLHSDIYHPGQSAEILVDNQRIGSLGQVHPQVLKLLDIPCPVLGFELIPTPKSSNMGLIVEKIVKYPSIRRDLSIVIPMEISAGQLIETIRAAGSGFMINLELFDVYSGEGIDLGKKSLALGLTFQKSSSTLIDSEVEAELGGILRALEKAFGAKLRE